MKATDTIAAQKNLLPLVLLAGGIAGTLDIMAACTDLYISTGHGPAVVFRYIASGVFGAAAFTGSSMMVWGILIHYALSFGFTGMFCWLYRHTRLSTWNRLLCAICYGVFIWALMNLVLVPMSAARHVPLSDLQPGKLLRSMLIIVAMIGVPLSFIAHWYYVERSATRPVASFDRSTIRS